MRERDEAILKVLEDGPQTAKEISKKINLNEGKVRRRLKSMDRVNLVDFNFPKESRAWVWHKEEEK